MIRGYARVSTEGQSLQAQVKQLHAAGVEEVWRETASGWKIDRVQLRRVVAHLEAGDLLVVTRLDRLARSTRDLLNVLAAITGKRTGFLSLGDAWGGRTICCRPRSLCSGGRADRWIARPRKRQEHQGGDESGNVPGEEKDRETVLQRQRPGRDAPAGGVAVGRQGNSDCAAALSAPNAVRARPLTDESVAASNN
jgi:hypothetical protein